MILLTNEEIQKTISDAPHNEHYVGVNKTIAKAQLKKDMETIKPILLDESTTLGKKVLLMVDLMAEWQSLLDEVKEA